MLSNMYQRLSFQSRGALGGLRPSETGAGAYDVGAVWAVIIFADMCDSTSGQPSCHIDTRC